jgi:16S rRNA (guanine527-N7)-methyltransferase
MHRRPVCDALAFPDWGWGYVVDFPLPTDAIAKLAGPLEHTQRTQLQLYVEMLRSSEGRVNLVSRRSLVTLQDHLIDSAALLSFREIVGGTVADLGSGAGFPGVVLSVLRPQVRVTLVESRRRKVVFLKSVVRELDLANLEVLHTRIEDLGGRITFDLALVRALDRFLDVLPRCLELVGADGALILFKGPRWKAEASEVSAIATEVGFAITRAEELPLPGLGRKTTFVELRRV